MKEILKIKSIEKKYNKSSVPTLDNLDLSIFQKEIFVLIGKSGCGKTSLLRCISGFEEINKGEIIYQDKVLNSDNLFVPPEKRNIGFVFQDYALFPHMTVEKNIKYGLFNKKQEEKDYICSSMLNMLEMSDYKKHYPHELSSGQMQRIALARSLAPAPSLILMDEPFNNLDPELKSDLLIILKELIKNTSTTLLFVTHDMSEATILADRVGLMEKGVIKRIGHSSRIINNKDVILNYKLSM